MNILYLYQYFTTPAGSYGTRAYDFASEWVKLGHKVTILTSVYYKSDIRPKKLIEVQYFSGIRVIILNILITNKSNALKRILNFVI